MLVKLLARLVAPDAAGPQEIITGPEGRLYPPGDADAAAAALRAILGDEHALAARSFRALRVGVVATPSRLRLAPRGARRASRRIRRCAGTIGSP